MKTWTQEDIDEAYEDELEDVPCPFCENRGYRVKLGPKILMPGQVRDSDYENWLECPTCYVVIPIYEMPKEETIKDTVETAETPFENKTQIIGIPKRNSPAGKRASAKKRRNKIKLDPDPEIDALVRIYGDRVKVVYDSDP